MLPGFGVTEIAIVLVIALVIFGPKHLPKVARSAGESVRELRAQVNGDRPHSDEPAPPARPSA